MYHHLRIIIASTTLILMLATQPLCAEGMTKGIPLAPFTPQLQTGDYVWHPEISPAGPVVILVSLSEQILYVYRNGVRIGRSSISSGKAGHRTPTGVFTVLQKSVKHVSTIFRGASMPYMERLTWGGVAMHGGNLPGYPASHACVRLPLEFAQKLYTITGNGTTVIVTDKKHEPGTTVAPGLLFAARLNYLPLAGAVVWEPEKSPAGPVSIIASSSDGVICVYRNGVEIGRARIDGLKGFKGSHVYSAIARIDPDGRRNWLSTMNVGGRAPDVKALVKRATVDPDFLARTRSLIEPGTNLILTDKPVGARPCRAADLDILTTASLQ